MQVDLLNITKSYAGNRVLDGVSLRIAPGQMHALVGENGAGKSTLMKILVGVEQADQGKILLDGTQVTWPHPQAARQAGIAMVFQELALVPSLSVIENIFLGRLKRNKLSLVDWRAMSEHVETIFSELGLAFDFHKLVGTLSLAEQQLVEIARALAQNASLIILDEPTSALSEGDARKLFLRLKTLSQRGVSIVFITHRLPDVFKTCHHVSILRDGLLVKSCAISELDMDTMVRDMVGRELREQFPAKDDSADLKSNPVALRVKHASLERHFDDVSFEVHTGEILGFAGLAGAGRTELVESIFGIHKLQTGSVQVFDQAMSPATPTQAVEAGLGLIADERKTKSLVLDKDVGFNLNLANQRKFATRWGWRLQQREQEAAEHLVSLLQIKSSGLQQPVLKLSGGNQQKVAIGKTLNTDAKVMIFDEPTRGIDVGAKREIYFLLRQLAARGAAIILVSSELEEILGLCDRILVMHQGRVVGELLAGEATQEKIMRLAVLDSPT
ncbi:MAG: sugar ABC transporter ATP-binding protein [bacterium]